MHCYEYPRPAVTSDSLLFRLCKKTNQLQILLIKRGHYPFEGMWALPGGFLDMEETVEQCAIRELEEETNIKNINLEQLITASKLGRDPRGRCVTVIFWAFVDFNTNAIAGDDAAETCWFNIFGLPQIAFDHSEIIDFAIEQLKFRINLHQHFSIFFEAIDKSEIELIKKILKN